MADTSFGERVWIVQGVEQDLRTDGRSRLSYRPPGVEANIIAQADGSARLHLGATDVLVGVKVGLATVAALVPAAAVAAAGGAALGIQLSHNVHGTGKVIIYVQVELAVPDSSTPDQGQVQVSVECSSCASPEFKVRQHSTFGHTSKLSSLSKLLASLPQGPPSLQGACCLAMSQAAGTLQLQQAGVIAACWQLQVTAACRPRRWLCCVL